jgi:putative spermidine/putrescine transport system permease protein
VAVDIERATSRPARSIAEQERRNQAWRFWAQMAPVLILYATCLVLPYASILVTSFYRYDRIKIAIPDFTFANYQRVVTDVFFLRLTGWTILIAGVVTVITLVLAYPMAWRIVRSKPRTKGLLLAIVLSPLLVNLVVRTYAWQVTLGETGVINSWLRTFGWIDAPLPMTGNMFAVIVGLTQITLPFMVLSLVSSMETMSADLFEAAEGLGAGPIRVFWKIMWPLTLPGVSAGSILVFSYCTSAFVTPAVLGGSRVATIATQIYQQFLFSLNWPLGSALVVALLLVNAVAIAVFSRMSTRST